MNSVADNRVAHLPALVSSDQATQHEARVHERLAARHRAAAEVLQAIGTEMVGDRDTPMGEHDLQAMSRSERTDALEGIIRAETLLVERVQQHLTSHQAVIDTMRS